MYGASLDLADLVDTITIILQPDTNGRAARRLTEMCRYHENNSFQPPTEKELKLNLTVWLVGWISLQPNGQVAETKSFRQKHEELALWRMVTAGENDRRP